MQRRKFSREFKLEAMRLVRERGVAVAQAVAIGTCTRTCCATDTHLSQGIEPVASRKVAKARQDLSVVHVHHGVSSLGHCDLVAIISQLLPPPKIAIAGKRWIVEIEQIYLRDMAANPDGAWPVWTDGKPPKASRNPLRQWYRRGDLRGWIPVAPLTVCAGSNNPVLPLHLAGTLMERYWTSPGTVAPAGRVVATDKFSAVDFVATGAAVGVPLAYRATTCTAATRPLCNPLLGLRAVQFLPQFINFPNAVESGKTHDSKWTWSARLAYEVTDTLNVYAS